MNTPWIEQDGKKLSRLGMVSERGNGAFSVGTPCNSVTHLMDSSWTST